MRVRDPERLRGLIRTRGLSQARLAELAEVSSGFVSHLIPPEGTGLPPRRRDCTSAVATRIAAALEVPVASLFADRLELFAQHAPSTPSPTPTKEPR